jgi:hypothetical protein
MLRSSKLPPRARAILAEYVEVIRIQAKAANKVVVVRSPASRNRSLVRVGNRAAVGSRNQANSSKSPDAKAVRFESLLVCL